MQARHTAPCKSAAAAAALAGGASLAVSAWPRRSRPHPHQPGRSGWRATPLGKPSDSVVVAAWFPWMPQHHDKSKASKARDELETALLNLCLEIDVDWPGVAPGSKLVVRPLALEWHSQASDVLTDAFAETSHLTAYKKLLRRRISSYLEAQARLVPRALIFTALVRSQTQEPPQSAPQTASLHSSSTTATTTGSHSGGLDSRSAVDSSVTEEAVAPAPAVVESAFTSEHLSRQEGEGQQAQSARQQKWSEVLVGTVEVSFDRSTHSASLTLQPPLKAAYLCNMAVASDWRRRGIGRQLIRAVEKACQIAGETDLYLHLRFQDNAAAMLYEAAGFATAASDPWLVLLIGQDRKRLMRKHVSPLVPVAKQQPQEAAVAGSVLQERARVGGERG